MANPKGTFLVSGNAEQWKKIVAIPAFEMACDYALLELQHHMLPNQLPGKPIDPYLGMDANAQMQGAARVLEILKTLAQPSEEKKSPSREKLSYA